MKGPRETHEEALKVRQEGVAVLELRANGIATARLVVFLAAVALLAAIAWMHLPSGSWLGVVGLVVAFFALVVVHARIHESKDRAVAAVRFHERALARMAGKWRAFPALGERWQVETHAYAGDLDVFGRASLFQLLDATSTRFGEEILARWLSGEEADASGEFAASVRARQAAVKDLAPRLALREQLSVVGSLLDDTKPDPRPFVMWAGQAGAGSGGKLPSFFFLVALVFPALTVGAAIAAGMGLVPRFAFFLPFAIDFAILATLRGRLSSILDAASSKESALSRYGGMLALLEQEKFESDSLVALQGRLKQNDTSATKEMASLSRIVGFLDARNNEVFRFFIGPMLMWELWCALALDRWRARAGRVAFGWFKALAELEALASLAGFAFENPGHAYPELVDEAIIEAKELGHPLIDGDKRVSNDVVIAGPGDALVVTGSNMSGKSTLLRALGINVVLANTGAPVCARALRLGRLKVATSMRVSDSLEEGTSRFYAELKKLKLVLDLARVSSAKKHESGTVLFLLDEILHGTNTRERLIGARAILKELLALGAMGAVSTHDLGLGDLEGEMPEHVKNVHFEEQVQGEVMSFDYKLRTGIVQSSNALRLMKIVGLDVVAAS